MRLSIKELPEFREDIAGMFRFAAELGCGAVQIHLPDTERLRAIELAMRETGVAVASVNAMSCDMLGPDRTRQAHEHRQVERALAIADRLGAASVTNFAGRDPGLDLVGNVAEFARVYEPHARLAERLGLRILFENCPMVGGPAHAWRNLAWCPAHWRAMFASCDSPALGLEFDVSHCLYTGLDAAATIRAWRQRIHHVQIKDARIDRALQAEEGVLAGAPHGFCPLGEGDLDATAVFAALADIGYDGWLTADIEGGGLAAVRRNLDAMRAHAGARLHCGTGQNCQVVRAGQARRQDQPFGHLLWWADGVSTPGQALTLGRCTIRSGEANPAHFHTTCSETLLVLDGRIEHTLDAAGGTIELGPGDAVVIPPRLVHRARNLGPGEAQLLVAFDSAERDFHRVD